MKRDNFWRILLGYKSFIGGINELHISHMSIHNPTNYRGVAYSLQNHLKKRLKSFNYTAGGKAGHGNTEAYYLELEGYVILFGSNKNVLKTCDVYKSLHAANTYSGSNEMKTKYVIVQRIDDSYTFLDMQNKKEISSKKYLECSFSDALCMRYGMFVKRMDGLINWVDVNTGLELCDEGFEELKKNNGICAVVKRVGGRYTAVAPYGRIFPEGVDFEDIVCMGREKYFVKCLEDDGTWSVYSYKGEKVMEGYSEILDYIYVDGFKALPLKRDDVNGTILVDMFDGEPIGVFREYWRPRSIAKFLNVTTMDGGEYRIYCDGHVEKGHLPDWYEENGYEPKIKDVLRPEHNPEFHKIKGRFPKGYKVKKKGLSQG